MKVLITGVNGFIGSHLAALCVKCGHIVLGLDVVNAQPDSSIEGDSYSFHLCDILDNGKLRHFLHEFGPNVIFNLAANVEIFTAPPSSYLVNYLPLVTISEYISNSNALLIHASSMLVCQYGNVSPSTEVDEIPSTFYGITKLIGEQILLNALDLHNMDRLRIARLTTIWGPGMYGPILRLFTNSNFIFTSKAFKSPKTFCYVANCCQDLLEIALNPNSFNIVTLIGDPHYISSNTFIESVFAARKQANSSKLSLIRVPMLLLWPLSRICDIFPFAYKRFKINSFHLANQINSNIISPLVADNLTRTRISLDQAMKATCNYYHSRSTAKFDPYGHRILFNASIYLSKLITSMFKRNQTRARRSKHE